MCIYINFLSRTGGVKAYKDVWCVGDKFLSDVFGKLQMIRSDAAVSHDPQPYTYDAYNVSPWFLSQTSQMRPAVVRFANAFIKALNEENRLPKYVVMFPDKDILSDLPFYAFGVKQLLRKELNWLLLQLRRCLQARRENLKTVHKGAVLPEYTEVIWVKMLARPMSEDPNLIKVLKLWRKFNETLEELLLNESGSYIETLSLKRHGFLQFMKSGSSSKV